jgi:hypothetical protein
MNAIDMLYNGTCLLARSRRRIYVANILIVHFGMELKKYTSIQLEPFISFNRDHEFDTEERKSVNPKRKCSDIQLPGMSSRGAQPVRQHHNRDETKILAIFPFESTESITNISKHLISL